MKKLRSFRSQPELHKQTLLKRIGYRGSTINLTSFMRKSKAFDADDGGELAHLLADGFHFRPSDTIPSNGHCLKRNDVDTQVDKIYFGPPDLRKKVNVRTPLHSNPVHVTDEVPKKIENFEPITADKKMSPEETIDGLGEFEHCPHRSHFFQAGTLELRAATIGTYGGKPVKKVLKRV